MSIIEQKTEMSGLEPIAVSALQHVSYCPRQYALIHIEQVFDENVFTLRGQAAHNRVDQSNLRHERGIKILRGLKLHADKIGLVGKADVVEVLPDGTYYPVEYKLGKYRTKIHDALQVAAQALCLEEMTGLAVPKGAIYHVESHQRKEILIDAPLREAVSNAIAQIRSIQQQNNLPPPVNDKRCRHCSLIDLCQPVLLDKLQHQGESLWQEVFEA